MTLDGLYGTIRVRTHDEQRVLAARNLGQEERILMSVKEKAIAIIRSLGDDVTIDDVIDRLYLLRKIELGISQAEAHDVQDHEEFMAELEREHGR